MLYNCIHMATVGVKGLTCLRSLPSSAVPHNCMCFGAVNTKHGSGPQSINDFNKQLLTDSSNIFVFVSVLVTVKYKLLNIAPE